MDIPAQHRVHPNNNPEQHGLEEGDVVDDGWKEVEVVEITKHGVRFSDGQEAAHRIVAINMRDTNATVN